MPETERAIREFRSDFLQALDRNLENATCDYETSETSPNAADAIECRELGAVVIDGQVFCRKHGGQL